MIRVFPIVYYYINLCIPFISIIIKFIKWTLFYFSASVSISFLRIVEIVGFIIFFRIFSPSNNIQSPRSRGRPGSMVFN